MADSRRRPQRTKRPKKHRPNSWPDVSTRRYVLPGHAPGSDLPHGRERSVARSSADRANGPPGTARQHTELTNHQQRILHQFGGDHSRLLPAARIGISGLTGTNEPGGWG